MKSFSFYPLCVALGLSLMLLTGCNPMRQGQIDPTVIDELPAAPETAWQDLSLAPLPFSTRMPYDWKRIETESAIVLQFNHERLNTLGSVVFFKEANPAEGHLADRIPDGSHPMTEGANEVRVFCLEQRCSLMKEGSDVYYIVSLPETVSGDPVTLEIANLFKRLSFQKS